MMSLNMLYGNWVKYIDLYMSQIEHGIYHNKTRISKHVLDHENEVKEGKVPFKISPRSNS